MARCPWQFLPLCTGVALGSSSQNTGGAGEGGVLGAFSGGESAELASGDRGGLSSGGDEGPSPWAPGIRA